MRRRAHGFTLLESMIVVTLLSIIALASMQFFLTATWSSATTATHQAILANANNALSLLKDDLRSATAYDDPAYPLNSPFPTGVTQWQTVTVHFPAAPTGGVFTPTVLPLVNGTAPNSAAGAPAAAAANTLSRAIAFRRVVPVSGTGSTLPMAMVFATTGGTINYSPNLIVYRFQAGSVLGAASPSTQVQAKFLPAGCTLYDLVREERDSANNVVRGPNVVAHHIQNWPSGSATQCCEPYFYYSYDPTKPQNSANFPELTCEFKVMYFLNDVQPDAGNANLQKHFQTRTEFLKVRIPN